MASFFGFLVSLALLQGDPAGSPTGHEQTGRYGAVTVRLQLDQTSVSFAGKLLLTLSVEGPDGLEIEPFSTIVAGKTWDTVSLSKPTTKPTAKGRQLWTQTCRLEPAQPENKATLAVAPLRFRASPEAAWQEHSWQPIPVAITTNVIKPVLSEIKDIESIEKQAEADANQRRWLQLAGGCLFGLLVFYLLARRQQRAKPPAEPPLRPDQWALRELERIDAEGLPASGNAIRYHELFADALRRYLELRFGLPVSQQTTTEFLTTVRKSSLLAPEQQDQLREFLERCDLAKFANMNYSEAECRNVAQLGRELVARTAGTNPAASLNGRQSPPNSEDQRL